MTTKLPKGLAMRETGVSGRFVGQNGTLLQDDFLPALRGHRAIRVYREMAENEPVIGAALHAMKQILRDVKIVVVPATEPKVAKPGADPKAEVDPALDPAKADPKAKPVDPKAKPEAATDPKLEKALPGVPPPAEKDPKADPKAPVPGEEGEEEVDPLAEDPEAAASAAFAEAAQAEADFVESVLGDMEHSFADFISNALSFLEFGFSTFEVVYKRRDGAETRSPRRHSVSDDGRFGIRKLAPRAQWTVDEFELDVDGEITALKQTNWRTLQKGTNLKAIPASKLVHFRNVAMNNEPAGRSVLRSAYIPYTYLKNVQRIEAIAIERELNGLPVGRIPAEYLSPSASEDQQALRRQMENILRDVKFNDQGYLLLPSDVWSDQEGKPSEMRMMDVDLIASHGTRNIDTTKVIQRYQHDIARTLLAEFLMLGGGTSGSFALSKSKTDVFLRSLESYMNTIVDTLNKQLLPRLWELNGLDYALMPHLEAGDVAPHDLRELAAFLRNLNGAGFEMAKDVKLENRLREIAGLPPVDEAAKAAAEAEAEQKRQDILNGMGNPGGGFAPGGNPNGDQNAGPNTQARNQLGAEARGEDVNGGGQD